MKKTILAAAAGLLVLTACEKKTETSAMTEVKAVDPAEVKTQIQAMETSYATNMMAKNVDSIMVYYGDDVMSSEYGQETISGKENLKKRISEQLQQMPAKADIGMQTDDILVSDDGTLVSEWGSYTMKDSTGASMSTGRFATVFRKNNGKYECVREMVVPDKRQDMKPDDKK